MDPAIQWVALGVQVATALIAAWAAWSARQAARASRDIVEDQRAGGRRARLEGLHGALTNLQSVASSGDFARVPELRAAQNTVIRHLTLLEDQVPAADAAASARPPETNAAGHQDLLVVKAHLGELRDLTIAALVEVEALLQQAREA